jgi:DNA invertase Pin-like site-specific DNA recombinase
MTNLAAIYARVSTNEQNTENQITELEALAAQRGLTIIQVYEDKGYSGKNDQRPAFQSMIKDAVSGRFNVLLCWHIDRLGRSLVDVVNTVQTIQAANVELILQQQSIDTTTPVGKAMLSMCAVFSELELSMMKERQAIGIQRARKLGKYKGRPVAIPQSNKTLMVQYVQDGKSYRKTADHFNVSVGTVQRAVANHR